MEQRKILFKAKRLGNNKWVEGDLLHDGSMTSICFNDKNGMLITEEVDPSTVCQFTGLKDKEGNPIYEGDIVDFSGEGEVIFKDGAFYVKFTGYAECLLSTLVGSKSPLMVICSKFDRKEEK